MQEKTIAHRRLIYLDIDGVIRPEGDPQNIFHRDTLSPLKLI